MVTPLLSTAQVAEQLGTTPEVVRAHIQSGKLKAANISPGQKRATYRVRQAWVDEFVERQMVLVAGVEKPSRRRRNGVGGMVIEEFI